MTSELNGNWIKINRSILNWEWRSSPNHYSVFCYCLERANFKDQHFKGILIKSGSFPTSHAEISLKTGLSTRQVRYVLDDLKKSGEIVTKSSRQGTVITIKNWKSYQIGVTKKSEELSQLSSGKRQENVRKVSTIKKVKKVKNEKNEKALQVFDLFKTKCNKKGTMTDPKLKLLLKVLDQYTFEDCKLVLNWVKQNWTNDPFWKSKMTVKTIFALKNFDNYLEQATNHEPEASESLFSELKELSEKEAPEW